MNPLPYIYHAKVYRHTCKKKQLDINGKYPGDQIACRPRLTASRSRTCAKESEIVSSWPLYERSITFAYSMALANYLRARSWQKILWFASKKTTISDSLCGDILTSFSLSCLLLWKCSYYGYPVLVTMVTFTARWFPPIMIQTVAMVTFSFIFTCSC